MSHVQGQTKRQCVRSRHGERERNVFEAIEVGVLGVQEKKPTFVLIKRANIAQLIFVITIILS